MPEGPFDQAITTDEMIYDYINIMDSIIQSAHHDVVHASISIDDLSGPAQDEADIDGQGLSTLAFSLKNSCRHLPEFIVTGTDQIESEDMIAIATASWPVLADELLAGEPLQLYNKLLYFLPVTLSGAANLRDGMSALRAAELRLSGEGVTAPVWIQIVHSDQNYRFPWEAGYFSYVFQPLAGSTPQTSPGSTLRH